MTNLSLSQFAQYLKPRPRDFHKGNAGHLLIVGGGKGFSGAVRMSAEAALRVGAGVVTVATHPRHAAVLNVSRPEIICHGVYTSFALTKLLKQADVVVVGPGLGQSLWGRLLLKAVLKNTCPLVLDADALNLLAKNPCQRNHWILTPHPGEAARLLKQSVQAVQQDRLAALQKIQQTYGGVCVLKGAGSLVGTPGDMPAFCDAGNPGMATAGMGDILSGVIGGLLAQGLPLSVAAQLGTCLHAKAGDLAAKEDERGMIASDLLPYLRQLVNPLA